jgi:hypothetical protein
MSNTAQNSSGGIGFAGLLTIVFITLKLCGVIAWSWWWVLSPLWIGFAVVISIALLVMVGALIAAVLFDKPRKGIRR